MAVVKKKNDAGVAALIERSEPVSIQEITMQDWYAAFAMINTQPMTSPKDAAREAWDKAEAMMEEREKRL